ncbi:hypothetical protein ACQW02_20010 [Humitalea sp. 24SJ18S-53]|uniref:hypothetical protein n=1 Tax=Humitalea sp. 24SJ18S-53 TaxID=3422307 RepID=UPI003D67394C
MPLAPPVRLLIRQSPIGIPGPPVGGSGARIRIEARDEFNAPIDPADLELWVRRPGLGAGTVLKFTLANLTRLSLGVFYADVLFDAAGVWVFEARCNAPRIGRSDPLALTVAASRVQPAAPPGAILVTEDLDPVMLQDGGFLTVQRVSALPVTETLLPDDTIHLVRGGTSQSVTGDVLLAAAGTALAAVQPQLDATTEAAALAVAAQGVVEGAVLLAQAAADSTAASVAGASIMAATKILLDAIVVDPFTGGPIAQLRQGTVPGSAADAGIYRYVGINWVRESDTVPRIQARVDAVEIAASFVEDAPLVTGLALAVVNEYGDIGLSLSDDGKTFAVGNAEIIDAGGDTRLARSDGASAIDLTATGVTLPGMMSGVIPSDRYSLAIADEDGHVGFGVLADGSGVDAGGFTLRLNGGREAELVGPDGSVLLTGLLSGAGLGLAGMELAEVAFGDFGVIYVDEFGFVGAGLKLDGTQVGTGLGGTSSDEYSLAEIEARNSRALALSAQAARGYVADVQRPTAQINHFIGYGQSLSNGTEGWPAVTKTARDAGLSMMGLSVHPTSGVATTWAPVGGSAAFQALVATVRSTVTTGILSDVEVAALAPGATNLGETILEGALAFLRRAWLDHLALSADPARRFLASSCGVGGRSIAALSRGASPDLFDRLVTCATAAKAIADAATQTYAVPAMLYAQGQQDYGDGTTEATFKAATGQLFDDFAEYVCGGVAGQTRPPAIFLLQPGGIWTADALQLAMGMASLELAEERGNVFCVGPDYPVTDKGGHLTSNGYRWLGQQVGKVMYRVLVRGQDWRPLSPISATWRGQQCLVSFYVPEPPLVFDLPYVGLTATTYVGKGFYAYDDDGAVTIAEAEIAGDAVVSLSLARAVVGDLRIRYAGSATYSGQGCLRDSDATVASENYEYNAGTGQGAGENLAALIDEPYPLHNWSVAFDIAATAD